MWAAQFIKFEKPYHWLTSGGLGTMGYGLPAAIGVQIAHPEALVIDVAGEASILMNIQEMSTAAQYRMPVKVFIMNNHWMGMVRQWQELLHGGRYSESYSDALPDFVKLADAFGWTGLRATKPAEMDDIIKTMIETPGPVIVDVAVDETRELLPDDPVGRGAQRDAAGSRRPESEPGVRRGHGAGVTKAQSLRHLDIAKKGEGVTQQIERHTISVMVDNEAGVLARVIGLFSGRGYNIESLTVAEVDAQHHFSRITVVTSGTPMIIEQIKNQLRRLVPVHRVTDLTVEGPSLERELVLVKVKGTGEKRVESLRIADIFRARVVDSTIESFVFEMTGSTEKLTAFINLMQPLGLVEVSRTGVVAISRGPEAI